MPGAIIQGQSVAAFACAHLLRRAGVPVVIREGALPRLPAILVGEATLALARDIFDCSGLFRNAHPIRKRAVLWGPGAEPVVLEHRAVAVSETELLDGLTSFIAPPEQSEASPWTIFASRPLPDGVADSSFGSRRAAITRVALRSECSDTCGIESFAEGWLFLIPDSAESGILFSVGAGPAQLLEQSRMLAGQIIGLRDAAGDFPCSPRIAWPLSGNGWLACGTAAMAFDPICGDGTGNAIREAILASAVIRGVFGSEDEDRVLQHYRSRMLAGFHRHLMLSRESYRTGQEGPWWEEQVNALDEGLIWCRKQAEAFGPFHYRLDGFELKRIF